jgi:hypothetical protein
VKGSGETSVQGEIFDETLEAIGDLRQTTDQSMSGASKVISIIPQKDKQGIHEITMPNSRKNIEINSFCLKLLPQGPPPSRFKIAPNDNRTLHGKTIPIILTIMVDFN